jgi:hypothetical protein
VYLEKLDSSDSNILNNYTLVEDRELDGTTGEHVIADQKRFDGFTFDIGNSNNKTDGYIDGDGSKDNPYIIE